MEIFLKIWQLSLAPLPVNILIVTIIPITSSSWRIPHFPIGLSRAFQVNPFFLNQKLCLHCFSNRESLVKQFFSIEAQTLPSVKVTCIDCFYLDLENNVDISIYKYVYEGAFQSSTCISLV